MNNKIIFIFCFFIYSIPFYSNAQNAVSISYYDLEKTSRNIGILFSKKINNYTYSIGLKAHINDPLTIATDFNRNLYSDKWIEHIGLIFNSERNIITKHNFALFGFYNLQLTRKRQRNIHQVRNISNGRIFDTVLIRGPYVCMENNIGIGIKQKIYKSLSIFGGIGGGLALTYKGLGVPIDGTFLGIEGLDWQFTRVWNIGLTYDLINESKKNNKISR